MERHPFTHIDAERSTIKERTIVLMGAACLSLAVGVAVERTSNPQGTTESEVVYEIPSGEEIEPAPSPDPSIE